MQGPVQNRLKTGSVRRPTQNLNAPNPATRTEFTNDLVPGVGVEPTRRLRGPSLVPVSISFASCGRLRESDRRLRFAAAPLLHRQAPRTPATNDRETPCKHTGSTPFGRS